MELTHASFFSGVGGLDLGLERAGWRTVSFSEIDPYASAVLAERWPGVPNLGDIAAVAQGDAGWRPRPSGSASKSRPHSTGTDVDGRGELVGEPSQERPTSRSVEVVTRRPEWHDATLWTGGFPCQDLSVAGKRAGLAGARSGLAYAFLDLVERHRPPAILLENVPGLLSSNAGRDLGALLSRLAELGYWWAYRILDAQFFGVPQRRRRVFICALHAGAGFGADSAAAVLSVGARCSGHSEAGGEARTGVALGTGDSVELAGSLTRRYGKGINTTLDDGAIVAGTVRSHQRPGSNSFDAVIGPPPDTGGMREAHGLASGLDDRPVVAPTLRSGGHGDPGIGRDGDEDRLIVAPTLLAPAEGGRRDKIPVTLAPTLRVGPQRIDDGGPGDTVPIVFDPTAGAHEPAAPSTRVSPPLKVGSGVGIGWAPAVGGVGPAGADHELLPIGLDSHRYRCCGNGVVSNVSEWIGWRLRRAVLSAEERAA